MFIALPPDPAPIATVAEGTTVRHENPMVAMPGPADLTGFPYAESLGYHPYLCTPSQARPTSAG
jgi:hypothetical protein